MPLRFKTLTVRRFTNGEWVNGAYVDGNETTFDVAASVQAPTPEIMDRVPEARRDREVLVVFTDELLKIAIQGGENADRITYNGNEYEVFSCAHWQNGIISHYKSLMGRIPGV